ncbi:N-acetylmuramoyl-L-alanine amidase [Actinopolyspora halophila]|uniref:N-acetylmuramoyl-L-alanine amidase n=1 Tax=Actinopolyspora halophila TaxID=1850 RepID=UPI00037EA76F|nr:N-acetylmuramoyl-L-alanine amidase [Actinopolyspora halophila]
MQWFNGPGEDLATVARETGYPVVEVDGWRNRGHGGMADHVGVIVCHHTASCEPEETDSNAPALDVVRDGRAGLPGPLAHYVLGFDGTVYVVAAGLAYHAGSGSWRGMSGNESAIGIEAEDSGDGDWTDAQLDAYPRLVARLCQFLGVDSAAVCAHREWAPERKIDPAGIDMPDFRRTVSDYLATPDQITAQEDDMRDDERQALFDVLQQHTGSRTPGEFPGWPSFVDDSERFTAVDYLRNIDAHTYHGRNLSKDSIRGIVREELTEVDPAKVSAETLVDRIAERLAPDEQDA